MVSASVYATIHPMKDTLHFGVILHDHGLAILDNGRMQMISSSYDYAR